MSDRETGGFLLMKHVCASLISHGRSRAQEGSEGAEAGLTRPPLNGLSEESTEVPEFAPIIAHSVVSAPANALLCLGCICVRDAVLSGPGKHRCPCSVR